MVDGRRNDMLKDEYERKTTLRDGFSTDEDTTRDSYAESGTGLSDVQRPSRRAEETGSYCCLPKFDANWRFEAAKWLQKMVGSLCMSSEPSKKELNLCLKNGLVLCILINKVHPAAVSKIVDNSCPSDPPNGVLSAYQYFENIKNFLLAVEDLGLPKASDLEQGKCLAGSMTKVVDSILALKSYCDWINSGAVGFWKYAGAIIKPGMVSCKGCGGLSKANLYGPSRTEKIAAQTRKRWVLPDLESSISAEMQTSHEFADDSTANGIHHIVQKFCDVLQVKTKWFQNISDSVYSAYLLSLDKGASHSLPSLVKSIIDIKNPDEVPMLVEFMLRKVMEELEHHLLVQNKHIYKLKHTFKELLLQKERQFSREKLLETLVAGLAEELKIVVNQLQILKMEKRQLEEYQKMKDTQFDRVVKDSSNKISKQEPLSNEEEILEHADQEHKLNLELQRELGLESQKRMHEMESQLAESRMEQLQKSNSVELESLQRKELMCRNQLNQQFQAYQSLRRITCSMREEVLDMQTGWRREVETLKVQLEALSAAAAEYHKVLAENRELYNKVQELKGNIRVYCRVRPSLVSQKERKGIVDYIGENGDIITVNPYKQGKEARKTFSFNKVFGTKASQEEVFQDTQPLIRSVLDGFNVCIFAYGQTGSGKTYTMSGPNICSEDSWGVNHRALNDLFQISQNRKDAFTYEVGVQMMEIYNEQVRDLLVSDGVQKKLEIRNNSQPNGLNVRDANVLPVKSTIDVLELMKIGQKNRAVGATALNERSSRSHSVLTVHVQGTDLATGSILRGCLHLVDLAGSERVEKSNVVGDRLREAQHINKSLSALGDVIAALAHKSPHVPYRNSKLTQLLRDSLGGQAKTLMFVHINSDIESYGETISTLKFAERVASIELGAARSNKETGEFRNLKEQVIVLQEIVVNKDAEILKRDVEISKKDAEIKCLQGFKNIRVNVKEANFSMQKPKARSQNLLSYSSRLRSEPQSQRLRKLVTDRMVNMEAGPVSHSSANRIPRPPSPSVCSIQDSISDDIDKNYEAACPTGMTPKSKAFEKDSSILKLYIRTSPRDCLQSVVQTSIQVNASKQNGRHHSLIDQEASLEDWRDGIQSSTESLLTPVSLDDEFKYWDESDPLKLSTGSTRQPIVGSSPAHNGDKSGRRAFFLSDGYSQYRHVGLQGAGCADRLADFPGVVSQGTETDGSVATVIDHALSQESYISPSGRSNVVERRSSQPTRIPRPPSRNDRKANKGEANWPKRLVLHQQSLATQSGVQSKTTRRWH